MPGAPLVVDPLWTRPASPGYLSTYILLYWLTPLTVSCMK